jgi:uncharacterized protein with PIN domain
MDQDPTEDRIFEGIPKELMTFEGRPFEDCIDCGRKLETLACPYAIQRVLEADEVIFEFALCSECMARLASEFSKESLERMQQKLLEVDLTPRGLAACVVCRKPAERLETARNVIGIIWGGTLVQSPSVVCSRCHESMESDLSRKTRDAWEEFVTKNFPGVPAHLDPAFIMPGV